ncbi:hypothetical protein GCM10022416_55390 [Actinomadura keratinilytica]|uniref:Uncharacterized protein n=1 Tax=Actinomadura keratinilytica TaxID=547461 RepID=A0ABP7ZEC3_9ACTN
MADVVVELVGGPWDGHRQALMTTADLDRPRGELGTWMLLGKHPWPADVPEGCVPRGAHARARWVCPENAENPLTCRHAGGRRVRQLRGVALVRGASFAPFAPCLRARVDARRESRKTPDQTLTAT